MYSTVHAYPALRVWRQVLYIRAALYIHTKLYSYAVLYIHYGTSHTVLEYYNWTCIQYSTVYIFTVLYIHTILYIHAVHAARHLSPFVPSK